MTKRKRRREVEGKERSGEKEKVRDGLRSRILKKEESDQEILE